MAKKGNKSNKEAAKLLSAGGVPSSSSSTVSTSSSFEDKNSKVPTKVVADGTDGDEEYWKKRIPNYFTYLRLVMVPAVAVSFCIDDSGSLLHVPSWLTPLFFFVATISDFWDGYLARKWNVTSDFGAFLDPVADKLLVSTILILLSARHGVLLAIPTAIIVAREVAVSALREWMAQRQLRSVVKVSWWGKVKTVFTMVALSGLLLADMTPESRTITASDYDWDIPSTPMDLVQEIAGACSLWNISMFFMIFSTVLTVTSGMAYFEAAQNALLGNGGN